MLSNVKLAELVDYSIVTQRDTYTTRNCSKENNTTSVFISVWIEVI